MFVYGSSYLSGLVKYMLLWPTVVQSQLIIAHILCSLRVCDGVYDDAMLRAWDEWDTKHISENDRPTEFAKKQVSNIYYEDSVKEKTSNKPMHIYYSGLLCLFKNTEDRILRALCYSTSMKHAVCYFRYVH